MICRIILFCFNILSIDFIIILRQIILLEIDFFIGFAVTISLAIYKIQYLALFLILFFINYMAIFVSFFNYFNL